MEFKYKDYFKQAPAAGYETLIYDCLIGDADAVPARRPGGSGLGAGGAGAEGLGQHHPPALPHYGAGSEGPSAANDLLARDGRSWRRIH